MSSRRRTAQGSQGPRARGGKNKYVPVRRSYVFLLAHHRRCRGVCVPSTRSHHLVLFGARCSAGAYPASLRPGSSKCPSTPGRHPRCRPHRQLLAAMERPTRNGAAAGKSKSTVRRARLPRDHDDCVGRDASRWRATGPRASAT